MSKEATSSKGDEARNTIISVVMPTLNEEEAISLVCEEIKTSLDGYQIRPIVVDSNSTDATAQIAQAHGFEVVYQKGKGYGDALMKGFCHVLQSSDSEVIVMMDADGTYDPSEIPKLIEPIQKGEADLVIGNRFVGLQPGSMGLMNRIGNRLLSWIARKSLGIKVRDTQCGMRALSRELAAKLELRSSGMPFAIEMLSEAVEAESRIEELPITYRRRIGESKLSPWQDGLRILGTILRLTRDYQPLLFFGGIGLTFAVAGAVLGVEVLLEWVYTQEITRLARVTLAALLIITGFQLFTLGLVADMIKGVRRDLRKRRPQP